MLTRHPGILGLAALLGGVAAAAAAHDAGRAWWIYTADVGVHRVDHAELVAAGLEGPLPTARLRLTHLGGSVPLWVDDGGDGRLDPGDHLEFVAEGLGEGPLRYGDHANYDAYRLEIAAAALAEVVPDSAPWLSPGDESLSLRRTRRFEEDELMIRLKAEDLEADREPDLWYWQKLTHRDRSPFDGSFDLPGLDHAGGGARLVVQLRGLSAPRRAGGLDDHAVELGVNGAPPTRFSWNGRRAYRVEISVAAADLVATGNRLEIAVPVRFPPGEEERLIDVVMLDWVEIAYPYDGSLGAEPVRFEVIDPRAGGRVRLRPQVEGPGWTAYGDAGARERLEPASAGGSELIASGGDAFFWVVPDGERLRPKRVERDHPSSWADEDNGADYLIIGHRSLLDAVRPLADFHRDRGLEVAIVDVKDVYDEFSHAMPHPHAIRQLVATARRRWRGARPRFVLLVGDASWDVRHTDIDDSKYANWTDRQLLARGRFGVKPASPYDEESGLEHRDLVPTGQHHTRQGHAASDNYFVAISGDDDLPDLAIGRFPVVAPHEVEAVVEKTLRYMRQPPRGSWRRRILWVTNESPGFQRRSDRLAEELSASGFLASRIYPSRDEASNERHQQALHEAWGEGYALVHFVGHGGRFIWRTGPPSLEKDHDLFTLDHLEGLAPSDRLPIVMSMTCHTGPFDHPNADSIAEKLLRVEDRGAIAVIAASWRTATRPSFEFSREFLRALLDAPTVGEAFMRAKREMGDRDVIGLYNLLGDPALEPQLARPGEVEPAAGSRRAGAGSRTD